MSINGLPFKLYKYKGVSNGVLDGLSKGKVWFSHLDKLNDPYENDYDYDDSMFFSNLNNYLKSLYFHNVSMFHLHIALSQRVLRVFVYSV